VRDRDEGRRADALTLAERQELTRLRRENRQLKVERDTAGRASFITGQSGLRTGMTKVGLPGATLGLQ
jgi:transposase-like protein